MKQGDTLIIKMDYACGTYNVKLDRITHTDTYGYAIVGKYVYSVKDYVSFREIVNGEGTFPFDRIESLKVVVDNLIEE